MTIPFMTGFLHDQFDPDYTNIERWQVYDRTTGECLPREAWNVNEKKHEVTILKAKRMHEYTISVTQLTKLWISAAVRGLRSKLTVRWAWANC